MLPAVVWNVVVIGLPLLSKKIDVRWRDRRCPSVCKFDDRGPFATKDEFWNDPLEACKLNRFRFHSLLLGCKWSDLLRSANHQREHEYCRDREKFHNFAVPMESLTLLMDLNCFTVAAARERLFTTIRDA